MRDALKQRLAAAGDLLDRYRQVWLHAWRNRSPQDVRCYTIEEAQFLPAALALSESPVPPAPRVAMGLIMTFALLTLVWSIFGQIEIVATAQGKVVPSDGTKAIQPLATATVRAIHVRDSQSVRADEVLMELDPTEQAADQEKIAGELLRAMLSAARAQAMLDALMHTRYAHTAPIARKRADDLAQLREQGFIASHAWLEQEQAAASLRRQIGVVLQENVLFNRSIRENIALADPGAPMEQVLRVATLAGAHEFILELPEAYDTMVGEHGATLSGGQRQRIAIARALMTEPNILILDEATSALDYESERILKENMKAIRANRTVLIIAHRLSTVRDADRIVVIERGAIVEDGGHEALVAMPEGRYARLHAMQMG